MSALYIIRHGNTFEPGDIVTRVGGRTDLRLSPSGQVQAKALGEHFAQEGILFSRFMAGPLIRTRETASLIGARLGQPLGIEIEEGLREIDYGVDENRPEDEVIARIGHEALDLWEKKAIPPEGWKVDAEGLTRFWQGMIAHWAEMGGNWGVVTSNGVARFAPIALGVNKGDLKLKTGAYGIIRLKDGAPEVAAWNIRPK